jgi:hypothetical protein
MGEQRLPEHRDFNDGEFETLYGNRFVVYEFTEGLLPISHVGMELIVDEINKENEGIGLKFHALENGTFPQIKYRLDAQSKHQIEVIEERIKTSYPAKVNDLKQRLTDTEGIDKLQRLTEQSSETPKCELDQKPNSSSISECSAIEGYSEVNIDQKELAQQIAHVIDDITTEALTSEFTHELAHLLKAKQDAERGQVNLSIASLKKIDAFIFTKSKSYSGTALRKMTEAFL